MLFLVTVVSTMHMGSLHYAGFATDFVQDAPSTSFLHGAWYSFTILAILGTHEMGHYLACRYYGIDTSLPYFIPAPPFILTGTLGAVIRIRERIQSKHMLLDIGAAGPIAGFVVTVPALALGLSLSRLVPLPNDFVGLTLGEPLLFRFVAWLIWGSIPEGFTLNLHPVGLAAWFGLLVTAINLFPIAQLDGGHISYATIGSRSTTVTLGTTVTVIALAIFVSLSWTFWALMIVVMLLAFGAKHPQTLDEHVPLDDTRRWIACTTLVIFVLCFTPAPIEMTNLLGQ
jgi:membrane-associated protease RseP (regulator of RpoE activity)